MDWLHSSDVTGFWFSKVLSFNSFSSHQDKQKRCLDGVDVEMAAAKGKAVVEKEAKVCGDTSPRHPTLVNIRVMTKSRRFTVHDPCITADLTKGVFLSR
jgi:hypothetical protein